MAETEQPIQASNEESKVEETVKEETKKSEDVTEAGDAKTNNGEADEKDSSDNEEEKEDSKEEQKGKDKEVKEEKKEKKEEAMEEDEEDEEEEEEEQKVGLLEQPVVLEEGSKRQRKKVERISMQSPDADKDKVEIVDGKGTALGDIPYIEYRISKIKAVDAKPLHKVLFKRVGIVTEIKKNIRKFNGFGFSKGDTEYEKKMQMLRAKSFTRSIIKNICEMLDVQRSGSKEEISERLIDFLLEPKDSGRKVPDKKSKRKSKGKGKTKRKGKTTKSKAKQSDDSDDDDKDDDDDDDDDKDDDDDSSSSDSDSSDSAEEPPKKKRKTLPKPKPKEKKAPAKKPATKKKASSKKKVDSDDDDVSDISSDSDDDKPLKEEKKETPPTNDELKDVIKKMLDSANLEEVTMKSVLKDVFAKYPDHDLSDRKEFVKNTVKQIIS